MPALLLLLLSGLMLTFVLNAYRSDTDPEEVFPPFVMTLLLMIYGLAILKESHHAFSLSLCVFALIAVLFLIVLIRRCQSGKITFSDLGKRLLTWLGVHAGFLVFLLVCGLVLWCYSTHFVLVWDDFHYNATFPKNCYYYGTMPTGFRSATPYKSYLPLLQLFFYWGFQGSVFSETLMFDYKMILIYVLLLPLFGRISQQKSFAKIAMGVATAILPFAFMYEVQESLSMDTVMGLLFAYAIMQILTKKRDLFDYYKIAVALLCLTLIKTIALIFTMICLAVWIVDWFIRRKENDRAGTELLFWIGSGALSLLAYFSWKLFCARNGNTNYLSRNLSDSLKGSFALPDYAAETIGNMFRSLFTMSTNLGRFGLSVAAVLALWIVFLLLLKFLGQLKRTDVAAFFVLFLGFAGYFAVLVYTYLFVFEQWEAESLSSLDRYLGTYSLMLATVLVYRLSFLGAKERKRWPGVVLPVMTALLLLSLTGAGLSDVLLPGRYLDKRRAIYEDRQEVHAEMAAFLAMDAEPSTMLTVNCEGNTVYDRAIDYEVLPHISRPLNVTEYGPNERNAAILERVADMNPDYVYFSAHERAYEDIGRYTLPAEYQQVEGFDGLFHRAP